MLRISFALSLLCGAASELVITRNSGAWFDQSVNTTLKPIQHAWNALRQDYYKVIGTVLVSQWGPPPEGVPYSGGAWMQFYMNASMPAESFTVQAVTTPTYSYLAVTGADVRGLIYGMYHVSGDILGVDPWWQAYEPHLQVAYAGSITVPASYSYNSGAPVYSSRGAFINDEDISGYFFTDPIGSSVYSTTAAAMYADLLLRLRVNTIIPSTFGAVNEPHMQVFAERGFIMGQHHVTVLGVNTYGFPLGVPWSYRFNPEPLQRAWADLVNWQQNVAGREMIYSLGYRSLNDAPFWTDDTGCNTTACRGAVISAAMGNQSAIIAATPRAPGTPAPRMALFLQMEMLALRQAGVLVIPPGTATVWTDFGTAFEIQGLANMTAGDGFYAHLASMSGWPLGGSCGQLTEWVTLATAFANIWEVAARKGVLGVINVSDLRHLPLTATAVFQYMWNPDAFNATAAGCGSADGNNVQGAARSAGKREGARGPVGWWPVPATTCTDRVTPAAAQAAYMLDFATRYFATPINSTQLPAAVAAAWQGYFNLPYMTSSWPRGDHFFGTSLRGLLEPFQADVNAKNHGDPQLAGNAEQLLGFAGFALPAVTALFTQQVLPLQQYLNSNASWSGPAGFWASHAVAQIGLHYQHVLAFQYAGAAALAWGHNDVTSAVSNMSAALAAIDGCLDYMRAGEGPGKWRGSYAAETWTWVVGTRGQMASLLASLQGQSTVQGPQDVYADYAMYAYECPAHDPTACTGFPLAGFNSSMTWDVMPRIACAGEAEEQLARGATQLSAIARRNRALRASSNGNNNRDSGSGSSGSSCITTVMGVSYSGSAASLQFYTPVNYAARGAGYQPPVIRYTTDGSTVTPSSPAFTPNGPPVLVSGNGTIVKVRAYDAVTGQPLLSENAALITQTST